MRKLLFLCSFITISFTSIASGNKIEGKWQAHDISITIEGVPDAISSAIAQQIKLDPSTECIRNSVVEVKNDKTFTLANACEQNAIISGTWYLEENKLRVTLANYANFNEAITVESITAELITLDVTDKIPKEFEFNGIKPTSLKLVLKKL